MTTGHGPRPVRPDGQAERHRHGSIGQIRQRIESASDTLKEQDDLGRHVGQVPIPPIIQRLLAVAPVSGTTGAPLCPRALHEFDRRVWP